MFNEMTSMARLFVTKRPDAHAWFLERLMTRVESRTLSAVERLLSQAEIEEEADEAA